MLWRVESKFEVKRRKVKIFVRANRGVRGTAHVKLFYKQSYDLLHCSSLCSVLFKVMFYLCVLLYYILCCECDVPTIEKQAALSLEQGRRIA